MKSARGETQLRTFYFSLKDREQTIAKKDSLADYIQRKKSLSEQPAIGMLAQAIKTLNEQVLIKAESCNEQILSSVRLLKVIDTVC